VLVGVVIAACYASGLAVIGHLWVAFWGCAGLALLAVLAGKVIVMRDGAGAVGDGPGAGAAVTGPDAATDPGVGLG
jgi:hypothetical protein